MILLYFKFSNLKSLSATPAYDYFYTDTINGEVVVDVANRLYCESSSISDFQNRIYNYFKMSDEWEKLIK